MARKQKVELMTSLPSGDEDRKQFSTSIQTIVDKMRHIADLKSQIKDANKQIRDELAHEKEHRNMCPKYSRKVATRRYDIQYGAEAKTAELDSTVEAFNEADILFKVKSAEPETTEE